MTDSILIFDMTDPKSGDREVRRFRIDSVSPKEFLHGVANADGAFIDYIEESSRALGDVSQSGSEDKNGIRWTLTSNSIDDADGFMGDVLSCMFALFGWTHTQIA